MPKLTNQERIILEYNKSKFTPEILLRKLKLTVDDIYAIINLLNEQKCFALELINCNIDDNIACILADALKNNISLHTLDLSNNNFGNLGTKAILESLYYNIKIKNLNLSGNRFDYNTGKHFSDLLSKNSSIIKLEINNSLICDTFAIQITQNLAYNTSIQQFYCMKCKLGDIGIYYIGKAIMNNKNIINFNFKQKKDFTYDTYILLYKIYETNPLITKMDINGYTYDRDLIKYFINTLINNKSIYDLNLQFNNLVDYTYSVLQILDRTNITHLKISDKIHLNDNCLLAIANLLQNNQLKSLNISWNRITDPQAIIIANAIKTNSSLMSLDISSNRITDIEIIMDAVSINTSILNIYIGMQINANGIIELTPDNLNNIKTYTTRNQLLYDNSFWFPYKHLDFIPQNSFGSLFNNNLCNNIIVSSLLCNSVYNPNIPNIPTHIMLYIYSFFQRKMFM